MAKKNTPPPARKPARATAQPAAVTQPAQGDGAAESSSQIAPADNPATGSDAAAQEGAAGAAELGSGGGEQLPGALDTGTGSEGSDGASDGEGAGEGAIDQAGPQDLAAAMNARVQTSVAKAPADDGRSDYEVVSVLNFDQVEYAVGATVRLTTAEAKPLLGHTVMAAGDD